MKKIKRTFKGKKFGELTVLRFDNNSDGKRKWIVECGGCEKKYSLSEHSLIYKNITTCNKCAHKKRRLKNTVNGMIWQNIRRRHRDNGMEISPLMTREYLWNLYLKQNKKCALSGKTIYLAASLTDKKENTASLDRINSSKGYLIDNIQWTHKKINKMKLTYSQDYFIELCGSVAEHNK